MFAVVKKYRFELLVGILLIALYFFTRLYHLTVLPIFTDEAIYVRWSQIAKQDASWRFISLTDGKQPMFVWVALLLMHIIRDPLFAGRMVSVLAGFSTLIGVFFLGKELFRNRWIGIISSFLYIISPFGLVYDRMALYDSLVTSFAVWGWYLSILLVRRLNSFTPFVLALVLGGGYLTKSSDFFIGATLPASLLLFDFKRKDRIRKFILWVGYAIIALLLAYLYYLVLRLSPFYTIISQKNALFVYPFSEWIHHPFTYFQSNMRGLWDWLITYTTWPIFLLIIGSFVFFKKNLREKVLIVIWFSVPFFYLAFFGNTLYPRFILFMAIPLLVLAAYSLFYVNLRLKNVFAFVILGLLAISISLYTDYFILTNFARAPIPRSDLGQYINDWPAGNGVKQSVLFFQSQAKTGKIFIGTEGTFGLMPYALEMYLIQDPNISLVGIWPIKDTMPKQLADASKKMPTYVVFYQPCPGCQSPGDAPITWPVTRIVKYRQGIGNSYLSIYRVKR